MRSQSSAMLAATLAITMALGLPSVMLAQDQPLDAAVAYLGGEEALTGLSAFSVSVTGTRLALDQGPTPGQPPFPEATFESQVAIDVSGDRMRLDHVISTPAYGIEGRTVSEVATGDVGFIDGQDNNFAPPGTAPMLSDRLASIRLHQQLLNPHLLVLEALADPTIVTALDDVEVDGTAHHAVEIAHGTTPTTLILDAETGQPLQATRTESDPLRRDVEVVVSYADWTADAIPFPGSVSVSYDDIVVEQQARTFTLDADIDEAWFTLPEGVESVADPELAARGDVNHQHLQTFAGVGFPADGRMTNVSATELAPGVHHVMGGSHHSLAVIQDDGVVIVDAPKDETRTAVLLEWLASVAPDKPVTHVVQVHHHVDHTGGLRSMAGGTGAAAVVDEAAVRFYEQDVFGATSEVVPDGVDGAAIEVIAVPAEGIVLGSGTNPVSVHRFPNPHAEDYLLVEAGGVLFVVDIFNPGIGAGPPPTTLVEAVEAAGLEVTTVAGGHGTSEPWPTS